MTNPYSQRPGYGRQPQGYGPPSGGMPAPHGRLGPFGRPGYGPGGMPGGDMNAVKDYC